MRITQRPAPGHGGQRGIALVTTMLIMLLMSALMVGFTTAVMSDQRYRSNDKDRVRAFYAAQSGLEKLSADLATLFFINVAPNAAEIAALGEEEDEPGIGGVTFTTGTDEGEAYGITPIPLEEGETGWDHITSGPYQGLIALKQRYQLDSSVRTSTGGTAHLKRTVETVAIPVFQFGIFSDVDLGFHAGPNFQFGGRVHSNRHLFLAQNTGADLTLPEKVTAVGEVVRKYLMNGNGIETTGHRGTVRMARAPAVFRNLLETEGSVTESLGSALNDPTWTNASLSTYNGYIRNGRTGAKTLNLPVVTLGAQNDAIVKRPPVNENSTNPVLYAERFYSKVSLRILLSDTAADLASLPDATAGAPLSLEAWTAGAPAGYAVTAGSRPMIARSPGPITIGTASAAVPAGWDRALTLAGAATIPQSYRHLNPMRVVRTIGGVDVTIADDLTCQGKTQTRFTNCNSADLALLAATDDDEIPVGSRIIAQRATPEGNITVDARATAEWDNNVAGDLMVDNTLDFAQNTFWATNTDDRKNIMVTCEGYTNAHTAFRDCNVKEQIDANAILWNQVKSRNDVGLIGGFIKIEMQDADNVWRDVTLEILAHGIGAPNQPWSNTAIGGVMMAGVLCDDPSPNAIIRLQRLRDNVEAPAADCSYEGSTVSTDYWPLTLFDPREGLYRDTAAGNNYRLGGVMHYITLDVRNLSLWLQGLGAYAGGSGNQALSINGYSVYFSDRRNNRNLANQETGEYGHEDIINGPTAGGGSNNALNTGEDANMNNVLDAYGNAASYRGTRATAPEDATGNLIATATHVTSAEMGEAKVNRALLFRRALKLTNGALGNIVAPGLTIVTENPVYVQGDWNANQASGFGNPHVATSIISDSVTLLSNAWVDNSSYQYPYAPGSRTRSAQSFYRFAVIAGKNRAFPLSEVVDAVPSDFGSDGGAHNFLRMLEGNGGTVNYRGSIATFYHSRQALGVYKCCNTVYQAPTRVFNFDTDFLNPALLPPLTPVFRDINAVGFWQETRPGM